MASLDRTLWQTVCFVLLVSAVGALDVKLSVEKSSNSPLDSKKSNLDGSKRLPIASNTVPQVVIGSRSLVPDIDSGSNRIPADASQYDGTALEESSIPKLIHQSWKNESIPERFEDWPQTWKYLHRTWMYKLWTDKANRELVETHFGWFLFTYDKMPQNIMRADAARYMYMYKYGGLYVDLDFYALKPHDELLKGKSVVLGCMTTDRSDTHSIPNAWMASVPGHPFWLYCLVEIARAVEELHWRRAQGSTSWDWIESTTGPGLLMRAVVAYEAAGNTDLTILDPGAVYPLNWHVGKSYGLVCNPREGNQFEAEVCITQFPDAWAVTFWTHGWK